MIAKTKAKVKVFKTKVKVFKPRPERQVLEAKTTASVLEHPQGQGLVLEDTSVLVVHHKFDVGRWKAVQQ